MFIEFESLKYLAPAGRYIYSTRDTPKVLKPQRGDMCIMLGHHRPGQTHIWDYRGHQNVLETRDILP